MIKADRKDRVFAAILVAIHLCYFLLALRFTRIYMGDSFEYIYEALNIKHHLFFYSGNIALPVEPEYMTQRQPLYPLMLLGVYLFSVNNWIVLLLQNVLSVCNIVYARKVAAVMGYSKRYDWLLLLLVASLPSQFVNANTIAPDILLQTFALLYAGNMVQYILHNNNKALLYTGLALVAGMLVKPVLYPFVAVHVVLLGVIVLATCRNMWQIAMPALMPVAVMLLYCGWNKERTGKFHFSSNQAFNAIYYYQPYVARKYGADSAATFVSRERARLAAIKEYPARYDAANKRGGELLRTEWRHYIPFHLLGSMRMLADPGKAELDLFTGRLTYGRLYQPADGSFYTALKQGTTGIGNYLRRNPLLPLVLLILIVNLFKLAGLVLFVARRQVPWLLRAFVLLYTVYFAVAAGPIANARYFLPVSLLVAACSCIGWARTMNPANKTMTT